MALDFTKLDEQVDRIPAVKDKIQTLVDNLRAEVAAGNVAEQAEVSRITDALKERVDALETIAPQA